MQPLLRRSAVLLGAFLALSTLSFASTLFIYPSIGPSGVSTYLNAYEDAAATALTQGATSGGVAGTPGYYAPATNPISSYGLIETYNSPGNFFSWMGNLNPAVNFGAAYAAEYGNDLYFGVYVNSDTSFNLGDVGFTGDTINTTLAGVVFSSHTIGGVGCTGVNTPGFNYQTDCTSYFDGTPLHTGNDTTPINFLWSSGVAIWANASTPAELRALAAAFDGQSITQEYTLGGDSSGPVTLQVVTPVPEPGTVMLFGLGLGAAIFARKRSLNRG
jgi:hypothetical protein